MTDQIVLDLEREIAARAWWMTQPLPAECLVCYTARMVSEFGCTGTLWIRHYRAQTAPRATALEERLRRLGAECDCAVSGDAYALDGWAIPSSAAASMMCRGVRTGSTQGCARWRPVRRR